jgi:hypothetical protein
MQLSWQHENGNLKSYIDVSFINDIKNQLEFLRGQWKEWVWREWEKERSGWWWKGMGRLARVVVATTEEKNFLKKDLMVVVLGLELLSLENKTKKITTAPPK